MIDNTTSQHENAINAHAVAVNQQDGGYKPLDEVLASSTGDAHTLPAATTTALGGVKQAAAVPDLAADADAATTAAKVNALLAALRASGAVAAK